MDKEIGNAAGLIWKFLDQQSQPVNLTTIKKNVDVSSTFLMMGLGWLTREGKLIFEVSEDDYSYKISVKR